MWWYGACRRTCGNHLSLAGSVATWVAGPNLVSPRVPNPSPMCGRSSGHVFSLSVGTEASMEPSPYKT